MLGFLIREFNKFKNKGSAIVTVIVVVSFISIMGTILLYVAGINYQMKVSDYMTKETFYGAEEVVELLRTQMIIDLNTASEKAFDDVICDYSYYSDLSVQLSAMTDPTLDSYKDKRSELSLYQRRFSDSFEEYFSEEWKKRFEATVTVDSDEDQYYTQVIPKLFPGAIYSKVEDSSVLFTYNGYTVYVPAAWFTDTNYSKTTDKISNIEVKAVSKDEFTSIISTSFSINAPTIDYHFKETGRFFTDDVVNNVFYLDWTKG